MKKKSKMPAIIIGFLILSVIVYIISPKVEPENDSAVLNNDIIETSNNQENLNTKYIMPETDTKQPISESITTTNSPPSTPENVIEIDYVSLWSDYSDEKYKDKWVKIIGKVHKKSFMMPIYFNEDLGDGLTDNIDISKQGADGKSINISDNYSEGDIVSVIGLVDGKNFGTVYIRQPIIESATDEDITKMNEYVNIRNQAKIQAENDYKNNAVSVDYDSLIRRPDDYKEQVLKVTVKITQIFDNQGILSFLYEKGYAGTQNGNEWSIKYELPEGASRIIEGDTVTFYGEFNGLQERTRAIGGSKVYIPHLIAKHHQ